MPASTPAASGEVQFHHEFHVSPEWTTISYVPAPPACRHGCITSSFTRKLLPLSLHQEKYQEKHQPCKERWCLQLCA